MAIVGIYISTTLLGIFSCAGHLFHRGLSGDNYRSKETLSCLTGRCADVLPAFISIGTPSLTYLPPNYITGEFRGSKKA
jgi:hypothetical protein